MAARKTAGTSRSVVDQTRGAGVLGPGQTPPVGIENAKNARNNIARKLDIYREWAKYLVDGRDGSEMPVVPLSMLPLSQNGFNFWTSAELPVPGARRYGTFWKNSNTTLTKNEDLFKELLEFQRLIQEASKSPRAERKKDSVAALHRRLSMAVALRQIAEQELVRTRREYVLAQTHAERLASQLRSAEAKATEDRADLQIKIDALEAERALLAATLKKVTGLRRAET